MEIVKAKIGDRGAYLTAYIQQPSSEMKENEVKPGILVLPGGAYVFCSDREAEPVALAYAAKGFQVFVLNYSTSESAVEYQPLAEASEAMGLIRKKEKEWYTDPDKIAACGFSAGGHLAAWTGLCGENRPNALVLCYPAVKLYSGDKNHGMPLFALLGKEGVTEERASILNLTQYVSEQAPPVFAWGTSEDSVVGIRDLLMFADAYAACGAGFELHVYQRGKHGISLGTDYIADGDASNVNAHAAKWLEQSIEWLYLTFGSGALREKAPAIPEKARAFRGRMLG
ncbi:MAG: alpha/beta hydrolase [Lachnospiraceae bacterium]|nr:alpha/beta hydrolase [Lachnospiraceae bacterium]